MLHVAAAGPLLRERWSHKVLERNPSPLEVAIIFESCGIHALPRSALIYGMKLPRYPGDFFRNLYDTKHPHHRIFSIRPSFVDPYL